MYTMPMILPMDSSGRVYVLQDKHGQVVGTGSREVCETGISPVTDSAPAGQRSNVRAAITI
jgi:hypothetical protein